LNCEKNTYFVWCLCSAANTATRDQVLFSKGLSGPVMAETPLDLLEKAGLQLFPNPAVYSITIRTQGNSPLSESDTG
jgi:hypothetical protein